ncbi:MULTISPECIES: helix-turn-helix domain-containing protein [Enterobacterales]|uniref:helix-turn-helix domain-containing protein n=1 Tax=Enterobacterales TaxID=91347 RepID=UPI0011E4983C|nr:MULTISPECIES: helix-turn-helix domain-containing protein [Enterobacterales]TYG19643.1 helix-turn-helix domain-containing protein [Klebsiella grimontii]
MYIGTEEQRKKRLKELEKLNKESESDPKNNGPFTQVYQKGWERIRELSKDKQGVVAIPLYSFLAEHIDPSCGAVVADQQFLADKLGVSRSTIIRWLNYLESKNALVRIPVAGKVCAYALDPHEVWKGYNTSKNYAAFVTKTLVNKDGDIQRRIMAMFSN